MTLQRRDKSWLEGKASGHHTRTWRDGSEFSVMDSLNWEKFLCSWNLVCVKEY